MIFVSAVAFMVECYGVEGQSKIINLVLSNLNQAYFL